jgi:hypothetical protein
MPATRYKIWAVGDPLGRGAMHSRYVGIAGVAKRASENLPYVVANELICGHLAQAVLLPTPTGLIIEHEGVPYYVSMNFNLAGEDLPPADAAEIVRKHPRLSCGIILFDIWVLNDDRHPENIAYDRISDKVQIFDHSHAFFSKSDPHAHLENNKERLAIENHCLAEELTRLDGVKEWADRIASVPDFYIREVVKSAESVGLPTEQVEFCSEFLLERRGKLLALIRENTEQFPKIQSSLWEQF